MTVTEIVTLLSAVAAFITSMAGVYVSVRNSTKLDTTHDALAKVATTVADVKTNVAKVEVNSNHIREQLVSATAQANLLQGRNEGIAQEKERMASTGEFQVIKDPAAVPLTQMEIDTAKQKG